MRVVGLVFLANPLREQPVQNRKINVNWGEAHAVVPQLLGVILLVLYPNFDR